MERPAPAEFDLALGEAAVSGAPEAFGESFATIPAPEALELGEGLEDDPAIAFRRTLGMFATGVTILTVRTGDQVHGMTANAFMSVSLTPPLVLISIDRRAKMSGLLHEGTRFGVSVLEAGQAELSDTFAGRAGPNAPEPALGVIRGTPLVEGALANLVARVVRSYWGGDHSLFLGHVEYARYGEGMPLLFHGGRYERLGMEGRSLSELPPELRDPLLASGVEVAFEDGAPIMRRGEPAEDVCLVLEGTVSVVRPGRTILLGAGDLIGEIEVLDGGPRAADITAQGPVRCLRVNRPALVAALEADPQAAIALIRVLASRFRETA